MKHSVFSIVAGNIASKGLGLLREVLFAGWFGTGHVAAAFRIGQTAFLLPIHAFVGDSLGAGLLPLYRQIQIENPESARILVLVASLYGLVFSAAITLCLYFFSHAIATVIAPGAPALVIELASSLLRILSLAAPFYLLSGMLSYLETAYRDYRSIAWRPMLLNLGSTCGAALAVWSEKDHWLATGILVSHVLFFIWTLFGFSAKDRIFLTMYPKPTIVFNVARRLFLTLLPLIGLPFVSQTNVLIERVVSSWLGTSVIPSVDYARFICDTFVQLIAIPLGILTMSSHGGGRSADMRGHIVRITLAIVVVAFPLAVFIATNAEAIVVVAFARGAFNSDSVRATSAILSGMGGAVGITVLGYYLIKALNAQLRNREALVFSAASCGVSIAINLALWQYIGIQVIGLAVVGYSLTQVLLCISALRLWGDVATLAAWMAPFLAIQAAVNVFSQHVLMMDYFYILSINFIFNVFFWGLLVWRVPRLNSAAKPVFERIPILRHFVT